MIGRPALDGILRDLQRLIDLILCAQIAREEARRTAVVPDLAVRNTVQSWLVANGLDDIMTVLVNSWLPPKTVWIINERELDASVRETLQHMRHL